MEELKPKRKSNTNKEVSIILDRIIDEMNSKRNSNIINALIANSSIIKILKDCESFERSIGC